MVLARKNKFVCEVNLSDSSQHFVKEVTLTLALCVSYPSLVFIVECIFIQGPVDMKCCQVWLQCVDLIGKDTIYNNNDANLTALDYEVSVVCAGRNFDFEGEYPSLNEIIICDVLPGCQRVSKHQSLSRINVQLTPTDSRTSESTTLSPT